MFKKRLKSSQRRHAEEIENWWLEDLISPPPGFDLKEVIPVEALHLVKRILGVEDMKILRQEDENDFNSSTDGFDNDTIESNIDPDELKTKSISSSTKDDFDVGKNKVNAYKHFFQRPHYKATIWRQDKVFTKEQMSLDQQANAVAESIAKNFVDWVGTIGGEEQSSITVERILELFDIGITKKYATSLKVDPKETSSGKKIGNASRQLVRKAIAPGMKNRIDTKKIVKADAESLQNINQEKLESMETVWKGIVQLKSTRDYLKFFLENHTNMQLPKYILKELKKENKN